MKDLNSNKKKAYSRTKLVDNEFEFPVHRLRFITLRSDISSYKLRSSLLMTVVSSLLMTVASSL
ncbi:hypothetical protein Bca101_009449 [Brassica carinata]